MQGTEVKWSSFVATQGSSGGTDLHSVELLAAWVPWRSLTTLVMIEHRSSLQKLINGPNCWGQHPHTSLNIDRTNWWLHGALSPTLYFLCPWKVLYSLQKEKLGQWVSHKTVNLQPILPWRCAGATENWGKKVSRWYVVALIVQGLVACPVIIRETVSGSRWELVYRSIAWQ